MALSNLTIFTPSIDRPRNLLLLAEYLQRQNYDGRLLVIDASSAPNKFLENYGFLDYVHKPSISCADAFYEAVQYSSTPYLTYLGDDDFPLLSGVWECCRLLDRKTSECCFGRTCWFDYRTAHHRGFNPFLSASSKRKVFSHKVNKQLFVVKGDTRTRLTLLVENYRVFQFALLTRDLWSLIYSKLFTEISDIHLTEIVSSLAIAAVSEQQAVSDFHLLRGTGHQRINVTPSDSRHLFPDVAAAESEVREYANQIFVGRHDIDSFVSACLSLRLLQYTNYFRLESPSKDELQSWRNDVLSSGNLIKSLKLIASLSSVVAPPDRNAKLHHSPFNTHDQ